MEKGAIKHIDEEQAGCIGAALSNIVKETLKTAYNQEDVLSNTDGVSGKKINEIITGIQSVWTFIERKIEQLGCVSVSELRLGLSQMPLQIEIRTIIDNILPELNLHENDLKNNLIRKGVYIAENIECQMGGQCFLQELFLKQETKISNVLSLEIINRYLLLQQQVIDVFGIEYKEITLILFLCLNANITELENIVNAQISAYSESKAENKKEDFNFFKHFAYFLNVYADVTQYLVENSRNSLQIHKRSMNVLKLILEDRRLQEHKRIIGGESDFNLYDILREHLDLKHQQKSLWFCGKLNDTPFDAKKIESLITKEISREALACVLVELNDYQRKNLFRTILEKVKTREQLLEKGHNKQLQKVEKALNSLINKAQLKFNKGKDREEKIELTKSYILSLTDPLSAIIMPNGKSVMPRDIIVRLLHPKTIVNDFSIQDEFKIFINRIKQSEGTRENPALAKSLKTVLYMDDPFLDVPLDKFKRKTIRGVLMELLFDNFDEKTIRHGFSSEEQGMLFPLVDAEGLSETKEQISKNFNTCTKGIERLWITNAAKEMSEDSSYHESITFGRQEVEKFLVAKKNGIRNYEIYFDYSGTRVFNKLMHCFPDIDDKDEILITGHEYGSMMRFFKKRVHVNLFDQKGSVEGFVSEIIEKVNLQHTKMILISSKTRFGEAPCSLNNKKTNTVYLGKVVEQLKKVLHNRWCYLDKKGDSTKDDIEEIEEITKVDGKNYYCLKSNPNTYYSEEKVQRIYIPIVIDGCQSLGRKADNLSILQPDVYFASGKKALGVGDVSFIALSQEFKQYLQETKSFFFEDKPQSFDLEREGTIPRRRIISMGLALLMQRSKEDLMRVEGNFGENRNKPLSQKISERMSLLTRYSIKKASEYGRDFVNNKKNIINSGLLVDDEGNELSTNKLSNTFGCKLYSPKHYNSQDFTGILTIYFPNVKGERLYKIIKKQGYEILPCRYKNRALRISMHYLHEEEDIDNLFKAIQEAHATILKDSIEKEKPIRVKFDLDED